MPSAIRSAAAFCIYGLHVLAGDVQRGEQVFGQQGACPWGVRGRLGGPYLG